MVRTMQVECVTKEVKNMNICSVYVMSTDYVLYYSVLFCTCGTITN